MKHILLLDPFSLAAYCFLALSVISLWVYQNQWIWLSLLGLANGFGFLAHRVSLISIFFEIVLFLSIYAFFRIKLRAWLKILLFIFICVLSVVFGLHRYLGFKNWLVFSSAGLTAGAVPFKYFVNFDKTLVGILLIGLGYQTIRSWKDWKIVFKNSFSAICFTCVLMIGLAYAVGYVRFDLKWFPFSWLWLFTNLLFVCVPEEAFFRGFVQKHLSTILERWPKGAWIACILTAVFFGLSHLFSGRMNALLAIIAGFMYGFVYLKTKRVEASILTHFVVNAFHFIAFSFPMLQKEIIHSPLK